MVRERTIKQKRKAAPRARRRTSALVAIAIGTLLGAEWSRAEETFVVVGSVEWISSSAVEVAGRRGRITESTEFASDGRTISLASIRKGMPAELELDGAGRVARLNVSGAVE